jgi:hypothetical protein
MSLLAARPGPDAGSAIATPAGLGVCVRSAAMRGADQLHLETPLHVYCIRLSVGSVYDCIRVDELGAIRTRLAQHAH